MGDKGWNHGIRGIRVEIMGDEGWSKNENKGGSHG